MFAGITEEGEIRDHFLFNITPEDYVSLSNRPAPVVDGEENNPEGMRAPSEKDSMRHVTSGEQL